MNTRTKLFGLLLLPAALTLSGCATFEAADGPEKADLVAGITQPVARIMVVPLLQKNPDLEPALRALADGVDLAFAQDELTPEKLQGFVDELGTHFTLEASDRMLIAAAVLDTYRLYVALYQPAVVSATDPDVVKVLEAFRDGIREGIAFYHAFAATL